MVERITGPKTATSFSSNSNETLTCLHVIKKKNIIHNIHVTNEIQGIAWQNISFLVHQKIEKPRVGDVRAEVKRDCQYIIRFENFVMPARCFKNHLIPEAH